MENGTRKRCVVGIGAVRVQSGDAELVAYAIGSCIALCLYDPTSAVGAMAHILLPAACYSRHSNSESGGTKYADHALDEALAQMTAHGANRNTVRAAMLGGAEMFPHGSAKILRVGERNIASVTAELEKAHIPLLFSDVGGETSRTVSFRIPGESFEQQLTVKSPQKLL